MQLAHRIIKKEIIQQNHNVLTMTRSSFFSTFIAVASSAVNITVNQVPSVTPTLNISWNIPQDGATVTGYTIHYNRNSSGGNVDVQHNTTLLIPNLIADGRPYKITIETKSIHLSGFTEPLQYELCKLIVTIYT